ncbi:hypothetical protein CHS0354_023151 [Potamilus streckersoni]|uniref:TIR domain-containing protein n=1 Tax=Potamilus streckersoni TaxID=2493646 RepID=A0AAE0RNH6_9BIVA|nr:hypothetical protein CHS0354_023151 [Potamilus streckersoni]
MRSKILQILCCIVQIFGRFPTCSLDAERCPYGCTCNVEQIGEKRSVSCETIPPITRSAYSPFPTILPNNTRAFAFRVAEEDHIFNESVVSFADITWGQVEEITLQRVSDLQLNQTRLSGLSRLKVLRLNYATLTNIHPDAFLMTPSVEVLDLSYNPWLALNSVVAALNKSLPKLKYLDLCNLQTALSDPLIFNKKFAMAIETKPLITLNISNSNIAFLDDGLTSKSIRYLNLSRTYSLWMAYSPNRNLFHSVEEIDISYIPFLGDQYGLETIVRTVLCIPVALSLKRLIANNLMTKEPIYLHDYRLQIMCNSTSIEEIYSRYSNIRRFNVTIDKTLSNLKLIDLEGNSMEFLSPKFMQKAPNLQEIYLARNKLSTMEDLENLFEFNTLLKVVDLSYNSLEFLPWTMFTHTPNLLILRLQGNFLSVFHLSIENMFNPKLLDLRENMIRYVSRETINGILSFGYQQGQLKISRGGANRFTENENKPASQMNKTISLNDNLIIDLTGNIMECTCDRIWFNEWILYTHISLFEKHLYTCKFDNNLHYMTSGLLNDMKYQCKRKTFLGAMIAIPCVIFLTIILAYVIVRRHRIIKRKALRADTLMERYNMNECEDRQRCFVFLSFAGRDDELVQTYIIPELEKFLKETFGSIDNLICTGDSHFTPGRWITEEIDRCLTMCDVFVMVVTKHFIKSEWCKYEVMLAKQKNKLKILLVNEDIYQQKIPSALRDILKVCTRATWRLQNHTFIIKPEWHKICNGMLEASAKILDEVEEGI